LLIAYIVFMQHNAAPQPHLRGLTNDSY
jgi:hypothetical protein